ncbi:MAG: quinoprotein relay system zinc metallohydrolase 2 [Alphaproteobacteria bacterium GM7ARS4]|nr:quinoprotein relay system zinc metallohydrolase 2 [Alphaproteobacteria bacterium GM7ARS4]
MRQRITTPPNATKKAPSLSRRGFLNALVFLLSYPMLAQKTLARQRNKTIPHDDDPLRITLHKVSEGLYTHVGKLQEPSPDNGGNMANMHVVIGSDSIAVFDTGYSHTLGQNLRRAIRTLSDKPISHVILSHVHPDHIFGASAFLEDNPIFIGHKNLPRALAQVGNYYLEGLSDTLGAHNAKKTRIVAPTHTVDIDKPLTISLGDRELRIEAWKPAHTHTDITALESMSQCLLTGDLVFVDHIPTFDGNTLGWLDILNKIENTPHKTILPGHGDPPLAQWKHAIHAMDHYLQDVVRDVRKLIKDHVAIQDAISMAAQNQKDQWQLFERYHPANVTFAFAELEWE